VALCEAGAGPLFFMSSVLGRLAMALSGAYAATKWALEAVAETLALKVNHFGVSVTMFEPTRVGTGAPEAAGGYFTEGDAYEPLPGMVRALRSDQQQPEYVASVVADTVA
jgi:NAD(P)-dependent dehydrogenase (short-subunit alcohol dehydrogenase family)